MLLLLAVQAMAAGAGMPARPANDPGSWITIDDYPGEALERHQEGVVAYTLAIDDQGRAAGCRVANADAVSALAAATCALVSRRARFVPARSPAGVAIAGTFSSRVRWIYPAIRALDPVPAAIELPSYPAERSGAADVSVGADGLVTGCDRAPRPYANIPAPPDICAAYPVGSRFGPPTTLHGKPQKRRVRVTMSSSDTYVR